MDEANKAAERWRISIHIDLRLRQPPLQFRRLYRRRDDVID